MDKHSPWPHRLRWLGHRPFKAEKRDRHPLGLPILKENILKFVYDREWWESLSDSQRADWLDWVKTFGVSQQEPCEQSPISPFIRCIPHVSLEGSEVDDIINSFFEQSS